MIRDYPEIKSPCRSCVFSSVNRLKVHLGTHVIRNIRGEWDEVEKDLPYDYFWIDRDKKIAGQVYCDRYRKNIQFPKSWLHCSKSMSPEEFEAQKKGR